MIRLIRTDSENTDFTQLVKKLDDDLADRDGKDHSFYAQFNKIDKIRFVVVAYVNELPMGCGAMKEYEAGVMEIKRMYVDPEHRGKGLATKILTALEVWAKELAVITCVLETGKRQPEAISLYKRNGYKQIDNYGQYVGINNSVCFSKTLGLE